MTEVLGDEPVNKLESDIARALRRQSPHEALLAGTLRELAPFSPRLLQALERALALLSRRRSFERQLYAGATRALAECAEAALVPHLSAALSADDAGGLASLVAAAMTREEHLSAPLVRAVTNRHPHLAFAAEVARVAREESDGEHSRQVAPMIKESYRISLCAQVFVPLLWRPALPTAIAPGLAVLRDSERHIGRWLVLAELGRRAGDPVPERLARQRAEMGTTSTRCAWALACWALAKPGEPPRARPSLDVLARLSDRPAADHDRTFLFRMGEAQLAHARPMLENMVKSDALGDATAIRAALLLGRRYARADVLERLVAAARCHRHEALRGLAAAALFDLGQRDLAGCFADELVNSNKLPTLGWAALIRAGGAGKLKRLVTEPRFRRVQLGWID